MESHNVVRRCDDDAIRRLLTRIPYIRTRWMDALLVDASHGSPKAFTGWRRVYAPPVNANISAARVYGTDADSEWTGSRASERERGGEREGGGS